jgi:Big-like domain-containing protein
MPSHQFSLQLSPSKPCRLLTSILSVTMAFLAPAQFQNNVVTYHYDNARTGQNVNETWLTPANVNKASFGVRFSQPVDGYIVGQPLYLSNVAIPNAGMHNVVYVATLHDSVYAFDADNDTGPNAAPLWQVNFTDPAAGVTTASGAYLPCPDVTAYPESGIVSTPVIDPVSGTMYVVAKTNENGTVYHRLHALDVTTGAEKFGPPAAIGGTFVSQTGANVTFNSLHAMNRPALLLNNGILYIAFGSNGCNDSAHGWVLSYDATSLLPLGIYNTSPQQGLASIWHTGSGPAADAEGYVYVSTGEGHFTANIGGQEFGSSVLKLFQNNGTLTESDYFTPYNQSMLSTNDLDLSASGVMVLPDQPGPYPHLLVASGKQGTVYLLNRDNLGQYDSVSDSQIVQELTKAIGQMFSSPLYWNNTVYFSGDAHPITAYQLSNGLLQLNPAPVQSMSLPGGHAPVMSSNGTTNGVLWVNTGKVMWAFDAVSLKGLYSTGQAGTRDLLPVQPHFSTQMVANGKVYIGTETNLMVYGLLPALSSVSGDNQTVTVANPLPIPLQVHLVDPYSGHSISGVAVTFSDGGKGGTFGTPTVVTDSYGLASTTYTFGTVARTVTITASNPNIAGTAFTETATPGPLKWLVLWSGGKQSAPVTTSLPKPIVTKASDQYGNGISGKVVTYSDGGIGGFSANPVTTDSTGKASTVYTTSSKAQAIKITASTPGPAPTKISETATAGPAASVTAASGNNQTGSPATVLPQPLTVYVVDQYANPVPGASVSFSDGGAGGGFSASPVLTDATGHASTSYTTPPTAGTVTIVATVGTLSTTFTETVQ